MSAVALLLWITQVDEPALREAERRRIAEKPPLTEAAVATYEKIRGETPQNPVKGYSLAVLPLSFDDESAEASEKLFLSDLPAYFAEASGGTFTLVAKRYDGVKLGCGRADLEKKAIRSEEERRRLTTAVRAWMSRDGEGIPAAHGGIAFVPAGRIGRRDTILWPHQGSLEIEGVSVPYIVIPSDAGPRAVGIAAHEFGHLLGLADKYEVGKSCLMGTGYSCRKPASLCAACLAGLGWARVTAVEARSERNIALSPGEVLRILLTSDGSESLWVEAREKDLQVWRTISGKAPEFLGEFPSPQSDRLTPFSDPPFIGRSAGAHETWLTDLRMENGTGYLILGPCAKLTRLEELRKSRIGRPLGK